MLNDLHAAVLSLWRRPRFSILAVLTLTIGMFLTLVAFAVLHAVVIRDLPYKDPDRLVVLWSSVPLKGIAKDWTSYPTLMDWKRANRSLEQFSIQLRIETAIMDGDEPARIRVGRVSADLFPLLGISPIRGRAYTGEEEARREPVVIIGQDFWLSRFNGSDDIVGKTIELDKKTARIVGVMPRGFAFPSESTDIWMPLTYVNLWPAFLKARQSDGFRGLARLKPGVSLEQARTDLAAVTKDLSNQYPLTDKGKAINATRLTDEITEPAVRRALWLIMLAVVLVLLVACGHVASLFLARSYAQRGDLSVRLTLGASMRHLMQLTLAESLVVSIIGGALALVLAASLLRAITALLPTSLPRLDTVRIEPGLVLFGLAVSFVSASVAGLAPAWNAAHTNIVDALRGAAKGTVGKNRQLGQRLLVGGQFAVTTLLVVMAALLALSYWKLQDVYVGFQPENVLVASIELPGWFEGTNQNSPQYFDNVINAVRGVHGVEAVGAVSNIFSSQVPNNTIAIEGGGGLETEPNINSTVAGDYFAALKIPLLQGRWFNDYDRENTPRVAVIDQTMATRCWHEEVPIGKRFRFGVPGEDPGQWVTIVGVVGETLPNGPESERISHFYLPLMQRMWLGSMEVVVRAKSVDSAVADQVRRAVRSVKVATPRFEIAMLQSQLDRLGATRRANTVLLLMFSVVSMLLTSIGLYALVHLSVIQRTSEIGLRIALGAAPVQVFWLILWEGIRSALSGIVTGLAGAIVLVKVLARFVYGIQSYDPVVFTGATILLLLVVIAATAVPALSATRMAPVRALSCE